MASTAALLFLDLLGGIAVEADVREFYHPYYRIAIPASRSFRAVFNQTRFVTELDSPERGRYVSYPGLEARVYGLPCRVPHVTIQNVNTVDACMPHSYSAWFADQGGIYNGIGATFAYKPSTRECQVCAGGADAADGAFPFPSNVASSGEWETYTLVTPGWPSPHFQADTALMPITSLHYGFCAVEEYTVGKSYYLNCVQIVERYRLYGTADPSVNGGKKYCESGMLFMADDLCKCCDKSAGFRNGREYSLGEWEEAYEEWEHLYQNEMPIIIYIEEERTLAPPTQSPFGRAMAQPRVYGARCHTPDGGVTSHNTLEECAAWVYQAYQAGPQTYDGPSTTFQYFPQQRQCQKCADGSRGADGGVGSDNKYYDNVHPLGYWGSGREDPSTYTLVDPDGNALAPEVIEYQFKTRNPKIGPSVCPCKISEHYLGNYRSVWDCANAVGHNMEHHGQCTTGWFSVRTLDLSIQAHRQRACY